MPDRTVYDFETRKVSREVVQIAGEALGNLCWKTHEGRITKASNHGWSESDNAKVKGTKAFLIGGSIGTNGYTGLLLPLIARNKIKRLSGNPSLASSVQIMSPPIDAATAGAVGAFLLALPAAARRRLRSQCQHAAATGRVPLVPLLDIGGTKTKFVLAHLNSEGCLTHEILHSHVFVTPKGLPPPEFYRSVAASIAPMLQRFSEGPFTVLQALAMGQPGRFSHGKDTIGEGTARDLGADFPGISPAAFLQEALKETAQFDLDVHVGNDGRAQFYGILDAIRATRPAQWIRLLDQKIVYFGIGTGLGAGYGAIGADGKVELFDLHNAFDVIAGEEWEVLPLSVHCSQEYQPSTCYEYGTVLSGKFFQSFMKGVELQRLQSNRRMLFVPHTGLRHASPAALRNLLQPPYDQLSPLNCQLLNSILAKDSITAKTEELVELNRQALERKAVNTFCEIAYELDHTMITNLERRGNDYVSAAAEVERAKRRGRRIQFIGIGKSHTIGRNLTHIFNNLNFDSSSFELTGADCENLICLREDDVVFLVSNSGRAAELLGLFPNISEKRCVTIALTGDPESPLARKCGASVNSHVEHNPHPIREAPTTSTTAALAVGTIIAIVAAFRFDHDPEFFYVNRPGSESQASTSGDRFLGEKRDPHFDPLTKMKDALRAFAYSIRGLPKQEGFTSSLIALVKRILVSHYNQRTVVFTGAGCSLTVADKVASTLTSIGIDAVAINPAQLPHGDLAHLKSGDLLVFVSFSGKTKHLIRMAGLAREKGVECAVITSTADSPLSKLADLCVVANSEIDDSSFVPVPDSKIFSSFINLTVGDALAVLLATVVGATNQEFARDAHPGGAIGRVRARLDRTFLRGLSRDRIAQIEAGPSDEHLHLPDCLPARVTTDRLRAYLERSASGATARSEVMIFGMGGIGLAFLAPLFWEQGQRICFVEKSVSRVAAMRRCLYTYSVECVGGQPNALASPTMAISGISIIDSSDQESVVTASLRTDTVFTAIGVNELRDLIPTILEIVKLRYTFWIEEPINFVFCENFPIADDPLVSLRHEIRGKLDDPELKVYFDECVGIVPAIDEALVPEIADDLSGVVAVEKDSPSLYVDRSQWKEGLELPQWKRVMFTDSFRHLHFRKLFVHNMGHALIGYLGYGRGYTAIYDAVRDPAIARIAEEAMLLAGREVYRRWNYIITDQKTPEEYVHWLLGRYANEALNDAVSRVCRDPLRKLGAYDRLVGSANFIVKYAEHRIDRDPSADVECVLTGIVAAMSYAIDTGAFDGAYESLKEQVLAKLNVDSRHVARAERRFRELIESVRQPEGVVSTKGHNTRPLLDEVAGNRR